MGDYTYMEAMYTAQQYRPLSRGTYLGLTLVQQVGPMLPSRCIIPLWCMLILVRCCAATPPPSALTVLWLGADAGGRSHFWVAGSAPCSV